MPPGKRRKVTDGEVSRPLSAIEAMRLRGKAQTSLSGSPMIIEDIVTTTVQGDDLFDGTSLNGRDSELSRTIRSGRTLEVSDKTSSSNPSTVSPDGKDIVEHQCFAGSLSEHRKYPSEVAYFTTLQPSKGNTKLTEDKNLFIKLNAGERLVVLGRYGVRIIKGAITILGARLTASEQIYPISAFSTHSLPAIRCSSSDCESAEICLSQSDSRILELKHLSPLFHGLDGGDSRNVFGEKLDKNDRQHSSTFNLVFSTSALESSRTYKTSMSPVVSPPQWNMTMSDLIDSVARSDSNSVTMLCGPKGAGKSTFATLLTNGILSMQRKEFTGIAFLDLDPGQPEYSVPGQLSLLIIKGHNFGPPFVHSMSTAVSKVVRAHSIGAVTPGMDSELYLRCVLNLLKHYRSMLETQPRLALIINTPGWVQGTGLELLLGIMKASRPDKILYMSELGPKETVMALEEAAKRTPIIKLPSQTKTSAARTAAGLRTMQMISYFHSNIDELGRQAWSPTPLTASRPLEITYSGVESGILGLLFLGEHPSQQMVGPTINGNLVAIVVVEDMAALEAEVHMLDNVSEEGIDGNESESDFIAFEPDTLPAVRRPNAITPKASEESLLLHTSESIPYFNPARVSTIRPEYCHSLGLALVRGIDTVRRTLQLLTPVSPQVLREHRKAGKSIILVSGKLDTPGWAYTEDLYRELWINSKSPEVTASGLNVDEIPWVEQKDDNVTQTLGKTLRVKRHLKKS